MIVSTGHRFVFAHVPKTGGIAMRAALAPYADARLSHLPAHDTLADLAMRMPETSGYFKFTFVRNPWDRLVSFYAYARAVLTRTLPQIVDFDWMLRALDRDEEWTRTVHALRPQSDFTSGSDFIGRFERLAGDFTRACAHIGIAPVLSRRNASQHLAYSTYYDNWSRSFVAARYVGDIEAFGYRFEAAS
jgi:chondroitin 4-sulfotransferase 11